MSIWAKKKMTDSTGWNAFSRLAADAMTAFEAGATDMVGAMGTVEVVTKDAGVADEVLEFTEETISEIDGFPEGCRDVRRLSDSGAGPEEIRDLISAPPGRTSHG